MSLPFTWRAAVVLLVLVTLIIYLGSAWTPALLDDCDAGHAEIAKEILERGDWVTFYMNGVRHMEKPPLLFWSGAIAYKLLGVNAVAARLPLIAAVLGAVLLAAAFGRRAGNARAGLYAGLALASCFGTYLFTRIFIADILLTFCVTLALYCFWRARQAPVSKCGALDAGYGIQGLRIPHSAFPTLWAFGFWVGMAGAVLAKGLVGMVFPLATVGLYIVATGEWDLVRRMRPVAGSLLFLLLAAPWHILGSLRTPHFAWFYFVNEHFLRYLGMRYPKDYDKVPLLLFWGTNLVWLFPWSAWLPLAAGAKTTKNPARLLWWIWAGVVLVFFSFSTRQEYYTMPAYPALALLLAESLARAEQADLAGERSRWLARLQAIPALAGLLAAAALGVLLWLSRGVRAAGDIAGLLSSNPEYYRLSLGHMFDLKVETFAALRGPAACAAVALGIGYPLAWWLRTRRRHLGASLATAATAAAFLLCAHAALVVFEPYLSSRALAQAIEKAWRPGDRIVLDGEYYSGSSIGFYLKPKLFLLNGRMTGLEFGSRYSDCPPVFIGDADIERWWREPGRVYLVTDGVKRARLEGLLPPERIYVLAASGGKFVLTNLM